MSPAQPELCFDGTTHMACDPLDFLAKLAALIRGLGNKLIEPMNDNAATSGRVVRRRRLGSALNYYHRETA